MAILRQPKDTITLRHTPIQQAVGKLVHSCIQLLVGESRAATRNRSSSRIRRTLFTGDVAEAQRVQRIHQSTSLDLTVRTYHGFSGRLPTIMTREPVDPRRPDVCVDLDVD